MLEIDKLRDWAGVADDLQDANLRTIEAAVIRFLEREANLALPYPPEVRSELRDVGSRRSGGLSGIGAQARQRIRLRSSPRPHISGTVTVVAGSTAVTGAGTRFLTQLSVSPPTTLEIAGENVVVDTITNDTSMQLVTAHVAGATGVVAKAPITFMRHRTSVEAEWVDLDPADFRLDGRTIRTGNKSINAGEATLEVGVLVGVDDGDSWSNLGLGDVELVVLELVRSAYQRRDATRAASVSVEGGWTVSYASFGEEALAMREKVDSVRRSLGFRS